MLILKKEDIKNCYSMKEAISDCLIALKEYTNKNSIVPLRTNINISEINGQSLYMPAYVGGENKASGIKIVSVYPDNIKNNLPSVPATMITLDVNTGIVNSIIDGTYLTQLRTGAVSGAATMLLSNENSKILALIGTGGQAKSQLEAILTVRKIEEVRIYDVDINRAEKFKQEVEKEFNVRFIVTNNSDDCISNADIITTVTTSKKPTFNANLVKKGCHINGVGSYTPEMCEIPEEIIKIANCIVFDTKDGVLNEAGDFINPIKNNIVNTSHYTGELGELYQNLIHGRKDPNDITIFKTVGSAVLDIFVANKIVKKAKEKSIGSNIEI